MKKIIDRIEKYIIPRKKYDEVNNECEKLKWTVELNKKLDIANKKNEIIEFNLVNRNKELKQLNEQNKKTLNLNIELNKKMKFFYGKCGGLKKHNNTLEKKIKELKLKILKLSCDKTNAIEIIKKLELESRELKRCKDKIKQMKY